MRIDPNRKPWMTKEVRGLLKARNAAFRSGDKAFYSSVRANLRRGICQAKASYRGRIEKQLRSNSTRQVWQGVQHITSYRSSNQPCTEGTTSLAEEMNIFFARFEATPTTAPSQLPVHSSSALTVEESEVRQVMRKVNPRKAAGPDGVSGRVLKDCADQLAGKIFNQSLSQATVPPCLKSSTIVPLPKRTNINTLNDYRPVALTPIIMKCLERLVRSHILAGLPAELDPLQFAYKAKRSTEDAVSTALHAALTHLEKQGSYVRMLFVDFSSAFNTILPQRLVSKLANLGLPSATCSWILDFLTGRSQRVRLGPHTSTALSLNTGSPQGCVLSPLLYTLYTHDCVSNHLSNKIIKFADDTTVVGLISGGKGELEYRDEVKRLSEWCKVNNLLLNTSKTKELVIDFRKNKTDIQPLTISGTCVERVPVFRFLGMELEDKLTWSTNTKELLKKAQQRLYFLRILEKNRLSSDLLQAFYHCSIESVLTYGLCVWYGSSTSADKKALQRVVRAAERTIGCPLPTMEQIYTSRLHKKVLDILNDSSHPGHGLFQLLPSGKRYRAIKTRTNRLKNSFYPMAIMALNSKA
uniref:Reverse transcriptase domain-containing protein n=1 Tax=Xiphophorus maculatus TaxID=8083 RepID=A0A3B5R0L5_XIPMA